MSITEKHASNVALESELNGEDEFVPQEEESPNTTRNKKKNKKRRKKPVTLPTLALIESHLLWRTKYNQTLGRHAVAKQHIIAGSTVVVEEAIVATPRAELKSQSCDGCIKPVEECRKLEIKNEQSGASCRGGCCSEQSPEESSLARLFQEFPRIVLSSGCDIDLMELLVKLCLLKRKDLEPKTDDTEEEEASEIWWKSESDSQVVKCGWKDALSLVKYWDKMNERWRTSVTVCCKEIRNFLKDSDSPILDVELCEMQLLAATLASNIHGLKGVKSERTEALGLFPVLSMFNHSCDPNCCFSADGTRMNVRALRDITPEEQLTVSYINPMGSRWLRQKTITETRFFECKCGRCIEPKDSSTDRFLEGIGCPLSSCSGIMVSQPQENDNPLVWKCLTCTFTAKSNISELQLFQRQTGRHCGGCDDCGDCEADHGDSGIDKATLDAMRNSPKENFDPGMVLTAAMKNLDHAMNTFSEGKIKRSIELFEQHILYFERILNPFHLSVFEALDPLLTCYETMGNFTDAIRICQRTTQSFEKVLNVPSLNLARYQKILGDLYGERIFEVQTSNPNSRSINMLKKQAHEALKKCHINRVICCGKTHPNTIEVAELLKTY